MILGSQVKESKEERYIGSMFLERRSLLLVSDDAYEYYLHEVAERTTDLVTYKIFNLNVIHRSVGEVVERKRRFSVCLSFRNSLMRCCWRFSSCS